MKVLWLSHSASIYGAERVMIEGVRSLEANGVGVIVVLPERSSVAQPWLDLDIPLVRAFVPSWMLAAADFSFKERLNRALSILKASWVLSKIIRRHDPDLVITNTIVTPVAALAARLAGRKHVWYLHEFGDHIGDQKFLTRKAIIVRMINLLSSKVIVNSKAMMRHFAHSFSEEKMRLLYCAVAAPAFSERDNGTESLKVVIVGGVSRFKGQDDAIRAVSVLADQGINVDLTIVGSTHDEFGRRLRSLPKDLGIASQVEFAGQSNDPFPYYLSADVALMCSKGEAFGRVTVEAMKMGVPVIGANCGGTSELINDGINGFLYKPGDVSDLADKMKHAYHNRDLLVRMGHHARNWTRTQFNEGRFANELLGILEEAMH